VRQSKSPTSPKYERPNAFGSFVNVSTETEQQTASPVQVPQSLLQDADGALADGMSTPPTPTQSGSGSMHRRLSRKQSRPSMITRDTPHTPWEVELNPSANGSLHNAIVSVDHLCKRGKRWIGVLGPSTDDIAPDAYVDLSVLNADPDSPAGGKKSPRPYSRRHPASRSGSPMQSSLGVTIFIAIKFSGPVSIISSLIGQHATRAVPSLSTKRSTSDLQRKS
jgi:hypothetical protein